MRDTLSSTVNTRSPDARSAPAAAAQERPQVAEVHEGVGRDDDVEGLTLFSEEFGQLGLHQLGVDLLAPGVVEHPGRQVDADQARRIRPQQWSAQPCAAPGVQHREPAVAEAGRRLRSGLDECRRPVGEALELGLEARRKVSKVFTIKAFDARAGTSRPVLAASICAAIASSGSSASHCSRSSTASSTWPIMQWARTSNRRVSRCFGRNVSALQKQSDASLLRPRAIQQDPEVGVGIRVIGR